MFQPSSPSLDVLNNNGDCANKFFTHTSSPTEFYGATLQTTGSNLWKLTMKNGTILQFPVVLSDMGKNPFAQALTSITDRYGNTVTITTLLCT